MTINECKRWWKGVVREQLARRDADLDPAITVTLPRDWASEVLGYISHQGLRVDQVAARAARVMNVTVKWA